MDPSTIQRLATIIAGGSSNAGGAYPKYRSGPALTEFFKNAGFPQHQHDGESRITWIQTILSSLSSDELQLVILRLCSRVEYPTNQTWAEVLAMVNAALEPEALQVKLEPTGGRVLPVVKQISAGEDATRSVYAPVSSSNGARGASEAPPSTATKVPASRAVSQVETAR